MEFEKLFNQLKPGIKGIAVKTSRRYPAYESDDLFQEMCLYLLNIYRSGDFKNHTGSYLLQGCWFYIKNYIRKSSDAFDSISLDKPLEGSDITLKDFLPGEDHIGLKSDFNLSMQKVLSDGLSPREIEVFNMAADGYTLREIGKELSVSHVMVYKIIKNIRKKASRYFFADAG